MHTATYSAFFDELASIEKTANIASLGKDLFSQAKSVGNQVRLKNIKPNLTGYRQPPPNLHDTFVMPDTDTRWQRLKSAVQTAPAKLNRAAQYAYINATNTPIGLTRAGKAALADPAATAVGAVNALPFV